MKVVGVIPAAGSGTRAQPLSMSKEVCPVWGKPALQHLVERMREAAVDEIRVATRPDKTDVIACAQALGLAVVLGEPQTAAESLLLAARGGAAEVLLIGFPDTVWADDGVFPALLERLAEGGADAALALFHHGDPSAADVVQARPDGRVERIDVKPLAPIGDRIWGCAAVRAGAIARLDPIEPGRTFDLLARQGRVESVAFEGPFADIGIHERLERARAGASLAAVAAG